VIGPIGLTVAPMFLDGFSFAAPNRLLLWLVIPVLVAA
jgi:hypothetical protein